HVEAEHLAVVCSTQRGRSSVTTSLPRTSSMVLKLCTPRSVSPSPSRSPTDSANTGTIPFESLDGRTTPVRPLRTNNLDGRLPPHPWSRNERQPTSPTPSPSQSP